jgi:hypothetical protein
MVEDLTSLADQICWGHRFVEYCGRVYVFRPLTLQEKNMARFVKDKAIQDGGKLGFLSKPALKAQAKRDNVWTDEHDKELEVLKEELDRLKNDLESAKLKSQKILIQRRIDAISPLLYNIQNTYYLLFEDPSLEYYSTKQELKYLVANTTLSYPLLGQLWNSVNELESDNRVDFVRFLIQNYYSSQKIIEETEIRKVARSNYWRICFKHKKDRLFDNVSLTMDQLRLLYWSEVYDSVYESYERPPNDVIEDDTRLDEWLQEQSVKADKDRKQKFFDKRSPKSKMHDAQEVGSMVDGFYSNKCTCKKPKGYHEKSCLYGVFLYYSEQDRQQKIKEVQESNPSIIRNTLDKEYRVIQKSGTIQEQDLRKDKQTRAILGMPTNTKKR